MNEYMVSAWYYDNYKLKQILRDEIFEGKSFIEAADKAKSLWIVQKAILDGHKIYYACDMLPRKGEDDE